MDGCGNDDNERVLTIGATNRPQELDDAARRRFVKKLFIPLPEKSGRREIIVKLLEKSNGFRMTEEDIDKITELTDGYSGADMKNLCTEAAHGPLRNISMTQIRTVSTNEVRPIIVDDFEDAMNQVKASVSQSDLNAYFEWDKSFGSNSSKKR